MAILFIDGFENYGKAADMAGYWSIPGADPQFLNPGRDASGSSIGLDTTAINLDHAIGDNLTTGHVGFAFYHENGMTLTGPICSLREATALSGFHLELNVIVGGNLTVQRSTLTLATSSKAIAPGVWYYIEMVWTIANAGGSIEVFVNGTKGGWIDFSGDTQNGGQNFVDTIRLHGMVPGSGGDFFYDDFYVSDTTGGAPGNGRLGDSIVETLNPSGAGAEAQWTPSAGSNFQNVDEATPDDDTTYNSSGTVADDDRFAMDNLVNTPSTIFGVQVNGNFRNENSGARTIRLKAFDGTTEGQSDDRATSFSATYLGEFEVWEDHPTDANPWSTAEVNAMEAGYRIQA